MRKITSAFVALTAAAGCAMGALALTANASPPTQHNAAALKAAAAGVTTAQANAMQARVVTLGEANSVLSNPYIEQKVTTSESSGHNATKVPAGGF